MQHKFWINLWQVYVLCGGTLLQSWQVIVGTSSFHLLQKFWYFQIIFCAISFISYVFPDCDHVTFECILPFLSTINISNKYKSKGLQILSLNFVRGLIMLGGALCFILQRIHNSLIIVIINVTEQSNWGTLCVCVHHKLWHWSTS